MCASTTDAAKEQTSNTALHLFSSDSTSSPMIVDSCNDGSSPSPLSSYTSILEVEDECNGMKDPNHDSSSSFIVNNNAALDSGGVSKTTMDGNIDGGKSSQVNIEIKTFCDGMITLPVGVCQGSTDFAEQMDIFMRCQHPLDILSMFHDDKGKVGVDGDSINVSYQAHCDGAGEGDAPVNRACGYYAIPRSCEYCGSPDVSLCKKNSKCERPESFFPRETPPFCLKGRSKWHGMEENVRIESSSKKEVEEIKSDENENKCRMTCSAWV
mmetsp:Transcript_19988/g.43475  ORF Transcript_19988/g.43475 Transcript_19988/m.43475 type:complete len:268 (-) Transcript_19988:137-940(-)